MQKAIKTLRIRVMRVRNLSDLDAIESVDPHIHTHTLACLCQFACEDYFQQTGTEE